MVWTMHSINCILNLAQRRFRGGVKASGTGTVSCMLYTIGNKSQVRLLRISRRTKQYQILSTQGAQPCLLTPAAGISFSLRCSEKGKSPYLFSLCDGKTTTKGKSHACTRMSLVSGPGRGGIKGDDAPDGPPLCVENHVKYIQSLDTVRHHPRSTPVVLNTHLLTAERRTRVLADRASTFKRRLLGFDGPPSSGSSRCIAPT